jgi:Protein of unknown function (DUF1501)
MLTVLGHPRRTCDGLSRRDILQAGALSLFGNLLPAQSPQRGKARSVILLDLFGGPSHIDMFDLKPAAPVEVRGEFKPIDTSLPGLHICEHLPQLARWMHRTCLIRSVSHRYNSHNPYAVMTGFTGGNDREDYFSKPSNHPSMGSVLQYLGVGRRKGLPGYVVLPAYPGYTQGLRRAGPYGGYLGGQFNPLFSTCEVRLPRPYDENKDAYNPTLIPLGEPGLPPLPQDVTLDTLDRRRTLLEQVNEQAARLDSTRMRVMSAQQQQAFDVLLSTTARQAFALDREPPTVRDRYGRDVFGTSMLLARRLVEAGVTFVTVHTEAKGTGHWDTHENNFNMLRGFLLPFVDRAVTALLDELSQRGLWDSTLVVMTGDMGRTPRVNAKAGRDHWPQCGFCLLAGGGVKEGYVHGSTDKQAAFPVDHPVSPGDLCATVYHQLGVDPETTVPDQLGRPVAIGQGGRPVTSVLA